MPSSIMDISPGATRQEGHRGAQGPKVAWGMERETYLTRVYLGLGMGCLLGQVWVGVGDRAIHPRYSHGGCSTNAKQNGMPFRSGLGMGCLLGQVWVGVGDRAIHPRYSHSGCNTNAKRNGMPFRSGLGGSGRSSDPPQVFPRWL